MAASAAMARCPLSFSLDHVGPLCRTVTDCAVFTQAIAGHDPDDPTTSREPVGDYLADIEGGVKGLRLGVPSNHFFDDVDDDVREAIEASIEVFRKLGAEIVEVEVPGIKHGFALGEVLGRVEAATYHSTWLRERPEDYGTQTRNRLMQGFYYPGTRYIEALNMRGQLLSGFTDAVFSVADMLIAPSVPMAVPTIAETDMSANQGFSRYDRAFRLLYATVQFFGLAGARRAVWVYGERSADRFPDCRPQLRRSDAFPRGSGVRARNGMYG